VEASDRTERSAAVLPGQRDGALRFGSVACLPCEWTLQPNHPAMSFCGLVRSNATYSQHAISPSFLLPTAGATGPTWPLPRA
jgi:hypothetical protein